MMLIAFSNIFKQYSKGRIIFLGWLIGLQKMTGEWVHVSLYDCFKSIAIGSRILKLEAYFGCN